MEVMVLEYVSGNMFKYWPICIFPLKCYFTVYKLYCLLNTYMWTNKCIK